MYVCMYVCIYCNIFLFMYVCMCRYFYPLESKVYKLPIEIKYFSSSPVPISTVSQAATLPVRVYVCMYVCIHTIYTFIVHNAYDICMYMYSFRSGDSHILIVCMYVYVCVYVCMYVRRNF